MDYSHIRVGPAGEKGRGLFALAQFQEGDIIFEEEPLVSCQFAWNEDCGYKACDHCMRPLETAEENAKRLSMVSDLNLPHPEQCPVDKAKHVPCQQCQTMYCSTDCRATAWKKYHKTLCLQKAEKDGTHPLEVLKQTWKEMYYPPETSTIMLFARIFAMIHQADDKKSLLDVFEQFSQPTAQNESVSYNLLGLKFSSQLDILREQLLLCVPTENVPQWATPNGFQTLVALVGMNGQGIGTSAVSDWVKNTETLPLEAEEKDTVDKFITKLYDDFENCVGEFLNNEGSGLYCFQSRINHSCRPNAEIAFPNSNYRLAVKCIRDIKEGDEICISYLDPCILQRSRHSRRAILETNYFFECKCERCDEEEFVQPDQTSSDELEDDDN
ncbi:UNVERIFIED_CONTAM: hypothetical protein PYX00_003923 [Menopon gallinae]|uniref:SET domain-containing protein n=1 Tax=Menopon gallinae TaxID=328185 RepID=A0AAW2I3N8_9NEOP